MPTCCHTIGLELDYAKCVFFGYCWCCCGLLYCACLRGYSEQALLRLWPWGGGPHIILNWRRAGVDIILNGPFFFFFFFVWAWWGIYMYLARGEGIREYPDVGADDANQDATRMPRGCRKNTTGMPLGCLPATRIACEFGPGTRPSRPGRIHMHVLYEAPSR